MADRHSFSLTLYFEGDDIQNEAVRFVPLMHRHSSLALVFSMKSNHNLPILTSIEDNMFKSKLYEMKDEGLQIGEWRTRQ